MSTTKRPTPRVEETEFRLSGEPVPVKRRSRGKAHTKEERAAHALIVRYGRCRDRIEALNLKDPEKDSAFRVLEYLRENGSKISVKTDSVEVTLTRNTVVWGRQFTTDETAVISTETAKLLWEMSFIREMVEKKEEAKKVESKGTRPEQQHLFKDK